MCESGCFSGKDRIYRIIFACSIVSRCGGLKEPIISDGFCNIGVPRGTLDWDLRLHYSIFEKLAAVSHSSKGTVYYLLCGDLGVERVCGGN